MTTRVTAVREDDNAVRDVDLSTLPDYLGFHLKMAQAAVQRGFLESLASVDITQRKHAVLKLVGANEHASQAQLAAALQIDRATMMTLVDRLEVQELLTRHRSKEDRRCQELALTPKGRALLAEVEERVELFERSLAERLSTDELATTIAALKKLYTPAG